MSTIKTKCEQNKYHDCIVRYCTHKRFLASNFCMAHHRANRLYGHPQGRKVRKDEFAAERGTVERLLRECPDHPGVKNALEWFAAWLARGTAGDRTILAQEEFERLARRAVTPRQIVTELGALWMYHSRNPHRVPDDDRLSFALAAAVLGLAPRDVLKTYSYGPTKDRRYKTAAKDTRHAIGKAIRERLGVLLHSIATEPDRRTDAQAAARLSLTAPFIPTLSL